MLLLIFIKNLKTITTMIEVDKNVQVTEESMGNRFKAGIHEKVTLSSCKYVKPESEDAKWKEAIDFVFSATKTSYKKDMEGNVVKNNQGEKIVISEAGDSITKREFYDEDSTDQKKKNFSKRIKHILTKFVPEEEAVVKGTTLEKFADAVNKKLEGKTEGVYLDVKVVMDRGYTQIPNYTPFIQLHGQRNLTISSKELQEDTAPSTFADLNTEDEVLDVPFE